MLKKNISNLNSIKSSQQNHIIQDKNENVTQNLRLTVSLPNEIPSKEVVGPVYEAKNVGENDNTPKDGHLKEQIPQEISKETKIATSSIQIIGPACGTDTEEKSDDYYNVVVRINKKWRVIACNLGSQWILQSQKGYYNGKPAWRSKSFCRAKNGLCSVIREKAGKISPEAQAQLAQLPDWIES